MDEVVRLLVQRLGMSKDKAKIAAETVIGYLKKKLPAPIAGQIDGILSGEVISKATDLLNGFGAKPEQK